MNRAVLVVLVDFLLISLVTLYSANRNALVVPPVGEEDGGIGVEVQSMLDMLHTLKQALEIEQATRQQVAQDLSASEASLAERQRQLAAREAQVRQLEANLQEAAQRARQLEAERSQAQAQQAQTQQALAAAQSQQAQARENLANLQAQLERMRSEANVSQAKVQAIEGELTTRREEVRRLQDQIGVFEKANREAAAAKERLAVDLGAARTEAALVRDQLTQTRTQISALSTEKAKLQETTAVLAEGTRDIARTVEAQRTLAPNAIYGDYLSNRVELAFRARRPGFLGLGGKSDGQVPTVLVRSGEAVFALCHVTETTLPEVGGGPNWESLTATLSRSQPSAWTPLPQLWLLRSDIRVVALPVPAAAVNALGAKAYPLASEPAKFSEALLVGSREGYYGEVEFKLDPSLPQYVRMQTRPLGKIFGKFSPSRGDLVFTKQGEVLGIMVNNAYCLLLGAIEPVRMVRLGDNIAAEKTGRIGAEISARVQRLPFKLR
ncbi:MAG TPA: hypothetical protein PKM73_04660 [Verrucomicrobiota bacterium]|nr:hypothetical protein [Verrucomicrobiota bacterium]HNU50629.1 hypothetical protein [Verrucomicrobiota bacterium]